MNPNLVAVFQVRRFLGNCRCQHQYPMIKVSDGKYRIGDNLMLIFVRVSTLLSHRYCSFSGTKFPFLFHTLSTNIGTVNVQFRLSFISIRFRQITPQSICNYCSDSRIQGAHTWPIAIRYRKQQGSLTSSWLHGLTEVSNGPAVWALSHVPCSALK